MYSESIDYLETLTPEKLGILLREEFWMFPPNIQYIKNLIAVGCPINQKDEFEATPLHLAARYGHSHIIELLLSNGGDINAKDKWGYTPLDTAVRNNQYNCIKSLISLGSKLNLIVDFRIDIFDVIDHSPWIDIKVLRLVILHGADITVSDIFDKSLFDNKIGYKFGYKLSLAVCRILHICRLTKFDILIRD